MLKHCAEVQQATATVARDAGADSKFEAAKMMFIEKKELSPRIPRDLSQLSQDSDHTICAPAFPPSSSYCFLPSHT